MSEKLMNETSLSLQEFTQRFCAKWQQQTGSWPLSEELYGIPSPCITHTATDSVCWQPQPFVPASDLSAVERALEIALHPDIHAFYTTQFAGDMPASSGATKLTLLQAWSEDDFERVQSNLIGHLVTQKRLKLPPTLFLATTEDEMEAISLCNLTGEVLLEKIGTRKRDILAPSLTIFLNTLEPLII